MARALLFAGDGLGAEAAEFGIGRQAEAGVGMLVRSGGGANVLDSLRGGDQLRPAERQAVDAEREAHAAKACRGVESPDDGGGQQEEQRR